MTDPKATPVSPLIENDSSSQEAGLFSRVEGTRTIRGLLLPYGELSQPNKSKNAPVMFSKGTVAIPRDVSVVTLNTEHDRFNPIGRALSITETDSGLEAEFSIADTDEGDAYLANPLRKLSPEFATLARDAVDNTRALLARLTGAAVTAGGAFESAALFSLAEDAEYEDFPIHIDGSNGVLSINVSRSPELAEHIRAMTPEDLSSALTVALPTSRDNPEEVQPPATPVEEPTQTDEIKELSMSETTDSGAQVPVTLAGPSVKSTADVDLNAVFSAMAAVKSGTSAQTADAETFLGALADIKAEATGGLTTPASGVIPATFAGKLWQGRRYTQRYIDLANHQYGGIQLGGRKGFKLAQGTALVAEVANAAQKVELPTGTASTSTYGSSLRKFGYAADVAREWFDLDGGAEVLAAFWEGVVDSYAQLVDEAALKDIFTVASKTSTNLDRLVAPGTYPTQYPAAMGQLIQGIELIQDANDTPSFAIVNPTAWNQLVYTPKDLVPEFVNFAVGIGTGVANTSGVTVVKAPQSFFTGTVAANPQVIVGAKNAIEFREQGTTPIQIEALNVAKYGVDRALVGFLETFVVRPESLALIGTKP